MISLCGLPAVPVGERCGVDLLLKQDFHYAPCPLIHHFNIPFCLKKNCCNKRSALVMHTPYLVDHMGCLSMPEIRIVVSLAVLPLFI
jgi:hypothetical protein